MRSILYLALLGLILICSVTKSYLKVDQSYNQSKTISDDKEMLYLPNGKGLKFISFGYSNTLSHYLWFNSISYFGKHYKLDRNYKWLQHMCNLVVDLNPKAAHVYEFCGMMLAWEANQADSSIEILSKAIINFPDSWKFLYLRGMTELLFKKNNENAKNDFVLASRKANAHPFVKRLAAKELATGDNPETAIQFLLETIANTKDDWERSVLIGKLQDIQYMQGINTIKTALEIYNNKTGKKAANLKQLVEEGIISKLGNDPWGGEYILLPDTGEVTSTTKQKK
jgi:tetratricopeptide (TPR) repeat protein